MSELGLRGRRTVKLGCLSFIDVCGMMPRPVGHEVDHLYGHIYTTRMRSGLQPISVTPGR